METRKIELSRISWPYYIRYIFTMVNKFYNISIRFNLGKSKNYKFWKCMDIASYKWFPIRSQGDTVFLLRSLYSIRM